MNLRWHPSPRCFFGILFLTSLHPRVSPCSPPHAPDARAAARGIARSTSSVTTWPLEKLFEFPIPGIHDFDHRLCNAVVRHWSMCNSASQCGRTSLRLVINSITIIIARKSSSALPSLSSSLSPLALIVVCPIPYGAPSYMVFVFAGCAALQYRTSALAAATVALAVAALAAAATAPVLLLLLRLLTLQLLLLLLLQLLLLLLLCSGPLAQTRGPNLRPRSTWLDV